MGSTDAGVVTPASTSVPARTQLESRGFIASLSSNCLHSEIEADGTQ